MPALTGRFKTLIILFSCENFRDEFPDSTGTIRAVLSPSSAFRRHGPSLPASRSGRHSGVLQRVHRTADRERRTTIGDSRLRMPAASSGIAQALRLGRRTRGARRAVFCRRSKHLPPEAPSVRRGARPANGGARGGLRIHRREPGRASGASPGPRSASPARSATYSSLHADAVLGASSGHDGGIGIGQDDRRRALRAAPGASR